MPGRRWWLLAALLGATGCSQEKVNELVNQAKQQAAESAEQARQALDQQAKAASEAASSAGNQAQQQLGLAGSMQFALESPITTKGCYVAFLPGSEGMTAVLQLRSYPAVDQEAFPSALVQAQVDVSDISRLAGQTIPAQVFVQATSNGTVWHTVGVEPAQLTIEAVTGKQITAAIAGHAVNTATGQSVPLAGTFDGHLE
jgi:hypothetical protein